MDSVKQIIGVLALLLIVGLVEGQTKRINDAFPSSVYDRCMAAYEGGPRESECAKLK